MTSMRSARLPKVSLLLVSWLVFGGIYALDIVLDVVEQSYAMDDVGPDFEQALESEDMPGFNGIILSHAGDVESMAFCRCFYIGPNTEPHSWLSRKSLTPPLYQLLSSYRI